jgi:uncharacterized protein (TIGR03435 family)
MGGPPGRYEAKNVTARMMVEEAYDVPADEVSGGAEWVSAQRFDIAAKIADAQWEEMKKLDSWRQGQITRLLLQSLLRERFHLTIAHQAKELQVYALMQAKGGARLRVTGTQLAAGDTPEGMYVLGFSDKDAPVGALAEFLSGYFQRSVLDQTGLTGRYDIDFSVRVPEQNTAINVDSAIFRELEDQLGLKLESRKAVVDTIVIERMEQPSAN